MKIRSSIITVQGAYATTKDFCLFKHFFFLDDTKTATIRTFRMATGWVGSDRTAATEPSATAAVISGINSAPGSIGAEPPPAIDTIGRIRRVNNTYTPADCIIIAIIIIKCTRNGVE